MKDGQNTESMLKSVERLVERSNDVGTTLTFGAKKEADDEP